MSKTKKKTKKKSTSKSNPSKDQAGSKNEEKVRVKKSLIAKRIQIERLIQQARNAKNAKAKVNLPRMRPSSPPYRRSAKWPQAAFHQASLPPVTRSLTPISILPASRPFVRLPPAHLPPLHMRLPPVAPRQQRSSTHPIVTFLNLPAELRNKIYELVIPIEFVEVCWASPGAKSLTYRLPHRPKYRQPKLDPDAVRRRRLFDLPRRTRTMEVVPPYQLSPGPAALLLTSKRIHAETTPYLYANTVFSFHSAGVLDCFLSSLGPATKAWIRNLHLRHHTAGNAFYTEHQPWKKVYDDRWDEVCWRAGDELPGLAQLSIDLTLNEVPVGFQREEEWRLAIMAFEDMRIERCSITLHNCQTDAAVLALHSRLARMDILQAAFVEGAQGEVSWGWGEDRARREARRTKVLDLCW